MPPLALPLSQDIEFLPLVMPQRRDQVLEIIEEVQQKRKKKRAADSLTPQAVVQASDNVAIWGDGDRRVLSKQLQIVHSESSGNV